MKIKKNTLKGLGFAASSLGMLFLGMDSASAATFSDVAINLGKQFQGGADLISGGSYLVGAGLGVQAALKFKEHNDNAQQVKMSKPLTYAIVSGCLLALPSFLTVGGDSTFGDDSSTSGICSGNLGVGGGAGCSGVKKK